MGTFIKYLIYIVILVAAFFIIKGMWDGDINSESTMKDVGSQVSTGVKETARDATDAIQGK